MARLLAIEWDAREARIAVAQPRGREIVLEEAFTVGLTPPESDGAAAGEAVGTQIAAALQSRNVAKGDVLVSLGRASIELKQMTLPPAPADELPEMVRFQALRQFTQISHDWPLDFVPLRTDDNGAHVLAAAISPSIVKQINATCAAADLLPRHLVLRPFAAASLLNRKDAAANEPARLMVDILREEADLTVLVGGQVALMRTVRLPGGGPDSAGQVRSMLGEIRRTIAAAQNQLKGTRIEKIVICGNGSDQAELKELVEQELEYRAEFFDPLDLVRHHRSLAGRLPEHSGRFAPLIGMLLDESAGEPHGIDFLHPRRKPEPPSQKRRNVLIAATAATIAIAILLMVWFEMSSKDGEIAVLTEQSNQLQERVEQANADRDDLAAVESFLVGDVTWLDRFYELCAELTPDPDADDATKSFLVTTVRMSTSEYEGGGAIVVEGYSRESDGIDRLRTQLRKRGFVVIPGGTSFDESREEFRWRFSDRYRIDPEMGARE